MPKLNIQPLSVLAIGCVWNEKENSIPQSVKKMTITLLITSTYFVTYPVAFIEIEEVKWLAVIKAQTKLMSQVILSIILAKKQSEPKQRKSKSEKVERYIH